MKNRTQYKYIWLFVVCSLISVGWIVVTCVLNWPTDAGRGGSIGVSIAFAVLFLQRRSRYFAIDIIDDFSDEILDEVKNELNLSEKVQHNIRRIDALKRDVKRARKSADLENTYLASSSVISTLCWGWGDAVVRAFNAS